MTNLNNPENSKYDSSALKNLIQNLILLGVSVTLIGFIVEYGIIQKSDTAKLISPFNFIITLFLAIFFVASCWKTIGIKFNQSLYFREEFSFNAVCSISAFILISGLSFFTRLMLWTIFEQIAKTILNQNSFIRPISYLDYALCIAVIISLSSVASQWRDRWNGRKSTEHHRQEQNSEDLGLWAEGLSEIGRRCLKGQPALVPYISESHAALQLQMVPQEILSWEERAKELVRLSSSSYAFDNNTGWHDKANCWVGKNLDTENLVFLYPVQTKITQNNLEKFEQYANQYADTREQKIEELIIAFRDDVSKLESFSGETDFIHFVTENSLLDGLVDFTDYRNEIRRQVSINTLPDVTDIHLTINDVYVDSQFSFQDNKQKSSESVEKYLLKWLAEAGQRQIALLGDYGQGKSTTMLMFTYRLLCESNRLPERIPILIVLRGKSPKTLRPLQLLATWAVDYRIEAQALMQLHYAGRLVLIFEGFDEMAMVSNVEMRLSHFKTLWQFCYPGAKIVITGRPNFFLDDIEKQKSLGIHQSHGNNPYSESIKLEGFTNKQIKKALRKYAPKVCQQIHELANKNSRFLELVSRPSLLHIVADLWEKEKLSEKAESLNSAHVMKLFVERSYRRQGLKEGDNSRFMALNSAERSYFMEGVATHMAAKGLNNQISGEDLNQLIDKLIESIPISVSKEPPITSGEELRPLIERLQEPDDYENIKTDVRNCGLLVVDPAASNTFKFGHKSFMEYLFASTVLGYLEAPNGSEKARAIFRATEARLETLLELPVSIEFLAELLCIDQNFHKDQCPIIDSMTSQIQVETDFESKNLRRVQLRQETAIASKLLRQITQINMSKIYQVFIPLIAFTASLDHVFVYFFNPKKLIHADKKSRDLISINGLTFVFMSFAILTTMSAMFIYFTTASPKNKLFFSVAISISSAFMGILVGSFPRNLVSLRVWNTICKEMGIQDESLHESIGIGKLPWTKNKSFDYFLDNSRYSQTENSES